MSKALKSSASSRHAEPNPTSDDATMPGKMVSVEFDINNPPPLTDEDIAELEKLAAMPDDEIDFSDIPPLTDEFFKNAIRNPFLYPPVRISADVVEYFQEKVGPGRSIMMEINHVLLDYIAQQKAKAKKAG